MFSRVCPSNPTLNIVEDLMTSMEGSGEEEIALEHYIEKTGRTKVSFSERPSKPHASVLPHCDNTVISYECSA